MRSKHAQACVIIAAMWAMLPESAAWARIWTDAGGKFSVEADLVSLIGDKVVLKTADGRTIQVPLASLSSADKKYVDAWKAERQRKPADTTQPPPPAAATPNPPVALADAAAPPGAVVRPDPATVLEKKVPFHFQDTPLVQVTRELAKATGSVFLLDARSLTQFRLKPDSPVSGRGGGKALYEDLNDLLAPLDFCCEVRNEAIVIQSKN